MSEDMYYASNNVRLYETAKKSRSDLIPTNTNDASSPKLLLWGEVGWSFAEPQVADFLAKHQNEDVHIEINSFGGDLFDGIAIYNQLRNHEYKVTTEVTGMAASAASLIFCAGDTRLMGTASVLMVHNPQMGVWGEAADMRKGADVLDTMRDEMLAIYQRVMPDASVEFITDLLDEETWLGGDDAIEMKLATGINRGRDAEENEISNMMRSALNRCETWARNIVDYERLPDTVRAALTEIKLLGAKEATPMPTKTQETAPEAGTPEPQLDDGKVTQIANDAIVAERLRVRQIAERFDKHPRFAGLRDEAIAAGWSADEAGIILLDAIGKEADPIADPVKVEANGDRAKMLTDALVFNARYRGGNELDDDAIRANDANPFGADNLEQILRNFARDREGVHVSDWSKREIVNYALHTTSDFAESLTETARRIALETYAEHDEIFDSVCRRFRVPDFKTQTLVQMGNSSTLEEVPEHAPYPSGTRDEKSGDFNVTKFGQVFGMSFEGMVNDDLGSFNDQAASMGRAARRTMGDHFAALLTPTNGATAIVDNAALFTSSHNNTSSGSIDTAGLSAARSAIAKQKGYEGETLRLSPALMIVPEALYDTALMAMRSTHALIGANYQAQTPNVHMGRYTIHTEPRIDDDNAAKWFMLASPAQRAALGYATLMGYDSPTVDRTVVRDVDGYSWQIRHVFAFFAIDYRPIYRGGV